MSLSKRTSVLFTAELYERLVDEAKHRGTSVGHLIRAACQEAYGVGPTPARLAAVRELTFLSRPEIVPEADPASDPDETPP